MAESTPSSLRSDSSASVALRNFGGVLEYFEDRRLQFVDTVVLPSCTLCSVLQPVSFTLPCSHVYCTACYVQAFKNGFCPVDDSDIDEAGVKSEKIDEKVILGLHVKCTNCHRGCNFVGAVQDVLRHLKNDCHYRHVVCTRCKQDVLQATMFQHYTRCRDGSQEVTSSGSVSYDGRLQQTLSRRLDEQMYLKDVTSGLVSDVSKNSFEVVETALGSFAENLSEIKYQSEASQNKLLERTEQLLEKVDRLLRLGKQTSFDEVHFNVENFAAFKAEARKKGLSSRRSDSFLIGGYTAKIRVDLKADDVSTYLGLSLVLCKGYGDAMLEWPFKRPYLFTLVHPAYEHENIEFTVCPYRRSDLVPECYMRPQKGDRDCLGNDKFSTVEVIERNGFVCNDTICVRLQLV